MRAGAKVIFIAFLPRQVDSIALLFYRQDFKEV